MRALLLILPLALSCRPAAATPQSRVLRVCADPNNLPFSNARGEGFENAIAELLAEDLHASLEYTWWPQRRGFFRQTLREKRCDVVIGVPKGIDHAKTTKAYYRSSFVFVTRAPMAPISSFDDPRLHTLRVGVHVGGDDGQNPPPAHALSRRGIVDNVHGYSLFGDYSNSDPPMDLLRGLESGEIDVAVAWGPLVGWFAKDRPALVVRPADAEKDGVQPLRFSIAMGVRRDDEPLQKELDAFLERRQGDVLAILDRFGVPR